MNIKNISIFIILSTSANLAFAETIRQLKGKWSYDRIDLKRAKCAQIDDTFLKQLPDIAIVCANSRRIGYDEGAKPTFDCLGKQFSITVLESKDSCLRDLKLEKANAD